MKFKHILQIATIFLISAIFTHPASALRTLGNNPFYHTYIQSETELKSMLIASKSEVKEGLDKAGYPQLYEPLYTQLSDVEISAVQYSKGQKFNWMFYRKKGKGKVRVDKDIVWESDEPMKSYEFNIDHDSQRYTMTVPPICGNLALAGISPIPAKPPATPPVAAAPETGAAPPETETVEQVKAADSTRIPILVDAGYLYQFDPAHHVILRVGTEYSFTESFSIIGMIGGAPRISGDDGKSAFIIDVFANYNFSRFFMGLGLGGWLTSGDNDFDDQDDGLDLIINLGGRIFGEADGFNTSLFVEARSAVDEFKDFDRFGRVGAGLRFRF